MTCTFFLIFACSSKLKKISLPDLSGSWDHGTDQTGKFILADGFYTDASTHVSQEQPPISDSTGTRKRKRSDSEGSDIGISFPCLAFIFLRVLRYFGLFNTMQA